MCISNFTFGVSIPQIIVCFVIVRFLVVGVRIAGCVGRIFVSHSSLSDNLYRQSNKLHGATSDYESLNRREISKIVTPPLPPSVAHPISGITFHPPSSKYNFVLSRLGFEFVFFFFLFLSLSFFLFFSLLRTENPDMQQGYTWS